MVEHSHYRTIHLGLRGPFTVPTIGVKKYILIKAIIKHWFTRQKVIEKRFQGQKYILEYLAWLGQNSKKLSKRIHNDNAIEVLVMKEVLVKIGTKLMRTMPYTLGANRLVECVDHTLLDKGWEWLEHSEVLEPPSGEAVKQVEVVHYKIVDSSYNVRMLHDLFFGSPTELGNRRTFRGVSYIHASKVNRRC